MKPAIFLLPLLILISGCSDSRDVMEELPNSSVAGAPREAMAETQIESTLARPVTIGEDGPQLDACGALGVVRGVAVGKTLAIHAAPFREAKATAQLVNDARVHVCTRSLDQKWLGVVVLPDASAPDGDIAAGNAVVAEQVDCGVSSPVDRRQAYDGPCKSGWISNGFVRLIAG